MMDEQDLCRLAGAGVDVGGHTINHPILRELPVAEARKEIAGGARWLERVTGRRVTSFAYPNGRPGRDFDQSHMRLAQEAGFDLAVSTQWGCASRGSDTFALPRVGFAMTPATEIAWRAAKCFLAARWKPAIYRG
jgi:peptidoglycan/xylan/chitin deacetylase (PgdA/CDA1 family)